MDYDDEDSEWASEHFDSGDYYEAAGHGRGGGVGDPEEGEQPDDDAAIQKECLENFDRKDFIMEPEIFKNLQMYFKSGGAPEKVVKLLSENYVALAQTVNLMAEWLILTGINAAEVQQMVEDHLKSLIIKHFDPKKADSIFTVEGETPDWLENMIQHATWRSLFYKLAQEYPDCLMLNFTIKLISDAGFQGEISNVSTACHQLDVFSRVFCHLVATLLEEGEHNMDQHLAEFTKMIGHGEHTYFFSLLMLQMLQREGPGQGASIVRRLSQEVQNAVMNRGHEVSQVSLALSSVGANPRACQAVVTMLSRGALNPADVNILFRMYSSASTPPVELIRNPQLLAMFVKTFFSPGSKINPEHKSKYIYLMAYAASVHETWDKGCRLSINKDELNSTQKALKRAHHLCSNKGLGASELAAEVPTLYQCVRYPAVAMGVLHWIRLTVSETGYFQKLTDHTPIHLALLDEIVNCSQLHHPQVLKLLTELFAAPYSDLDVLQQLEIKKVLLDRMVHLLGAGHPLPVIQYIHRRIQAQDTDISLIRHFVAEVLDIIDPPYSAEFEQLFMPIIENEEITGKLKSEDGQDAVSNFIVDCKSTFTVMS